MYKLEDWNGIGDGSSLLDKNKNYALEYYTQTTWKYLKEQGLDPTSIGTSDILYPKWTKQYYKTGD